MGIDEPRHDPFSRTVNTTLSRRRSISELLTRADSLNRTVFANEHGVIGQHGSISVACQDAGTGQSYGRGHRHHLLAERRSLQHSPECRRSDSSCTM